MDIRSLLPLVVQFSLILLVFGIGLQSRWSDVTYVLRRPGLLARGIFAVNVVVPTIAIVLCMILPIAFQSKSGLILMALSPMAPFAVGKMHKACADTGFITGFYVALMLSAVLLVPITGSLAGALFAHEFSMPFGLIAAFVAKSVLLPLSAGLLFGTLLPTTRERGARLAALVSHLLLVPVLLIVLYAAGGKILGLIGDGTLAAIVVIVLAALTAGHLLGGPEPDHRMALAQAAATRHPGIAALIAHRNFEDPQRVMLTAVLFLLTSMLVSAGYQIWATKHFSRRPDVASQAGA